MSSLFYRGNYVYLKVKTRYGQWKPVPLGIKVERKERRNGKWIFPKSAREIQEKVDRDHALGIFGFRAEVVNGTPTLSAVAEEYYNSRVLSGATRYSYTQVVGHAVRIMGDLPIIQYRVQDFEQFRRKMLDEEYSVNTVARMLSTLHFVFEFARKKRKYVTDNPVDDVSVSIVASGSPPFSESDLQKFFRFARARNPRAYWQCMFLLLTGCRSSESCALRLDEINADADEFAYQNIKGRRRDAVPMTDELREFFTMIPREHSPWAFFYRTRGGLYASASRAPCGRVD
jgi:integrase